jgi:hypothetical protein
MVKNTAFLLLCAENVEMQEEKIPHIFYLGAQSHEHVAVTEEYIGYINN